MLMKRQVVGVCFLVARFAFGQSAIGVSVGLTDTHFFTPSDEDLYYADYAVTPSLSSGVSWFLKGADSNLVVCSMLRDELELTYDARQFITNASFANTSQHQLTRYTLKGARLWNVISLGRAALYLGAGLGLTATQVRSSQGQGFNTRLLQLTDTAGNVYSYPGPVHWAYEGRKPDAFHTVYLTGALVLDVQVALSRHWGLDLWSSVELLLTPWLNEEGIRFTSNRTFEGRFGVHYWLRN